MKFLLTKEVILEDAYNIHEFRGDGSYALTSFLREVETVLLFLHSYPDVKPRIQQIVLTKIQGEALNVIRTLGQNPSWEETRKALITNFGIKETYNQLYQKAFSAKNIGIVYYYKYLENILCKINEKFEYDDGMPLELGPPYSEKIILQIFIENIDYNLASILVNRNVSNLREAFILLQREGLIRDYDNKGKENFDYSYFNNNNCTYVEKDILSNFDETFKSKNTNVYGYNTIFKSNDFDNCCNADNGIIQNFQNSDEEIMDLNFIFDCQNLNENTEYIDSFDNTNETVCTAVRGDDKNNFTLYGISEVSENGNSNYLESERNSINDYLLKNLETTLLDGFWNELIQSDKGIGNVKYFGVFNDTLKIRKIVLFIDNKVPYLWDQIDNEVRIFTKKISFGNNAELKILDKISFHYKIHKAKTNRRKMRRIYSKRKRKKPKV